MVHYYDSLLRPIFFYFEDEALMFQQRSTPNTVAPGTTAKPGVAINHKFIINFITSVTLSIKLFNLAIARWDGSALP